VKFWLDYRQPPEIVGHDHHTIIQSGNENFELMVYPSERHSFVKPAAWYDEYRRMAEYFETWLGE
jgi:dipeptidyl aminopeptidase/acylaminoacyl peptidase